MKKIFLGLLATAVIGLAFTTVTEKEIVESEIIVIVEADKTVEGIKFFKGTWEQALEKSEEEGKLIFLDAYASWCGPCKIMARTTFKDSKVGEFFQFQNGYGKA